jgi:hypothetical protein
MRALLGILLMVWLTLPVSHPAFAEKRIRPEVKQAPAGSGGRAPRSEVGA